MYSAEALSTLWFRNHHLHLSPELLHLAKLKLCPRETLIPAALPQPLALTLRVSLGEFDHYLTSNQNHAVFFLCLWFISLP